MHPDAAAMAGTSPGSITGSKKRKSSPGARTTPGISSDGLDASGNSSNSNKRAKKAASGRVKGNGNSDHDGAEPRVSGAKVGKLKRKSEKGVLEKGDDGAKPKTGKKGMGHERSSAKMPGGGKAKAKGKGKGNAPKKTPSDGSKPTAGTKKKPAVGGPKKNATGARVSLGDSGNAGAGAQKTMEGLKMQDLAKMGGQRGEEAGATSERAGNASPIEAGGREEVFSAAKHVYKEGKTEIGKGKKGGSKGKIIVGKGPCAVKRACNVKGDEPRKSSSSSSSSNGSTVRTSGGTASACTTKVKATKVKVPSVVTIKAVVIPPPVAIRREIPGHHVVSSRRKAVLARTLEKETQEAQRDFEEAVAAAERSRVAREQRLKASARRAQSARSSEVAAAAAAAAKAVKAVKASGCSSDGVRPGSKKSGSAKTLTATATTTNGDSGFVKGEEKCPDLGFGGQPWGLGPFSCGECERTSNVGGGGSEGVGDGSFICKNDGDSPAPQHDRGNNALLREPTAEQGAPAGAGGPLPALACTEPGEAWAQGGGFSGAQADATAAVKGACSGVDDPSAGNRVEKERGETSGGATAGVARGKAHRELKVMRRARVEAGEAVDLGDEAAFRQWLARLRDVEVCARVARMKAFDQAGGRATMDGHISLDVSCVLAHGKATVYFFTLCLVFIDYSDFRQGKKDT